MYIAWHNDAWDDYLYWQTQDKKTLKRINTLLKDIARNPSALEGIGRPEALKYNLSECLSREIDSVNRIVYTIHEDYVLILRCRGHYKF